MKIIRATIYFYFILSCTLCAATPSVFIDGEPLPNPPKDKKLKTVLQTKDFKGMAFVEGGVFSMGSTSGDDDEKPVHKVKLSNYYIDKYEVTNEDFCKFLNEKGNQTEGGVKWLDIEDEEDCLIEYADGKYKPMVEYEKHPVIEITWFAASSYCKWRGKRLPTEAEWEYAAKGGKKSKGFKYSGGNKPDELAWYDTNSDGETYPVGTKKPNELGVFDMSGNVWEWCADWYSSEYYKESAPENPKGPGKKEYNVLRGGSWVSIADELRPETRDYAKPFNAFYLNGFRCVAEAPAK
ncbi:MAG TPA: serine/threonine protein kinase [Bacteroidales bacterium]|nr:serine/threonine protein kinase [Bacteroidales bacterium]